MRSTIYGQKIERKYKTECTRNDDGLIIRKPKLIAEETITYAPIIRNSGEVLSVDGEIGSNRTSEPIWGFNLRKRINISEDTEVEVLKEVYRADLNGYIVYTDFVISSEDVDKCAYEVEVNSLIAEYNKTHIEKDEKARTYCDIHKLNYEETDYDKLISLINPTVKIENSALLDTARYYVPQYMFDTRIATIDD